MYFLLNVSQYRYMVLICAADGCFTIIILTTLPELFIWWNCIHLKSDQSVTQTPDPGRKAWTLSPTPFLIKFLFLFVTLLSLFPPTLSLALSGHQNAEALSLLEVDRLLSSMLHFHSLLVQSLNTFLVGLRLQEVLMNSNVSLASGLTSLASKAAVPNLFWATDRFRVRNYFHGPAI